MICTKVTHKCEHNRTRANTSRTQPNTTEHKRTQPNTSEHKSNTSEHKRTQANTSEHELSYGFCMVSYKS